MEAGIVAKNVLHDELGYFSDSDDDDYGLDETTRDRLIAHGRQDAAHTLINTMDLMKAISKLETSISWHFTIEEWSSLICIVLLALILWRVW